jgi:hypothetical protein
MTCKTKANWFRTWLSGMMFRTGTGLPSVTGSTAAPRAWTGLYVTGRTALLRWVWNPDLTLLLLQVLLPAANAMLKDIYKNQTGYLKQLDRLTAIAISSLRSEQVPDL